MIKIVYQDCFCTTQGKKILKKITDNGFNYTKIYVKTTAGKELFEQAKNNNITTLPFFIDDDEGFFYKNIDDLLERKEK